MKLNNDCVRDFLLTCEDVPMDLNPGIDYFLEQKRLTKYPSKDIVYSMKQLYEARFIDVATIKTPGGPKFNGRFLDITWNGHQFLDDIRSDNVWEKTKEKVKSTVGSTSLQVMSSVASSIALKFLGL